MEIYPLIVRRNLLLDKSLKRVPIISSIFIVFFSFFILDMLLLSLFRKFNFEHEKLSFVLLLVLSTILFYSISTYFLRSYHLWFNWFVPLIIFQGLELIFLVKKKSTKSIFKIIKILRR